MELINNRELIIEIKHALTKKGIGQAELGKMLEEHGHTIAKTTIQRLFKEGSEDNDSFSYKSTLKPIAELVLDKTDDSLTGKIDCLIDKIDTLCEMILEDRKLVHAQISIKDTRMERKDGWIQEQRDEILELRSENKRLHEEVFKLLEKCRNCERK